MAFKHKDEFDVTEKVTKKIDDAIADSDSEEYARISKQYELDIEHPYLAEQVKTEQLFFEIMGRSEDNSFSEENVSDFEYDNLNISYAYGVKKTDLRRSFIKPFSKRVMKTNFDALKMIFNGLYQFRVPAEISEKMNSFEILSLYLGIAKLKSDEMIVFERKGDDLEITWDELLDYDFPMMISKLVSYGTCKYQSIRDMKNKGFTLFHTVRGDLQKRMSSVDKKNINIFVKGLKQRKMYSDLERSDVDPLDFHDPNYSKGYGTQANKSSLDAYIQRIVNLL